MYRKNEKKNTTAAEKLKQMSMMPKTMSPYTYPKETGIQEILKDCHVLLPTKVVKNSLDIN